MEIFGRDTVGSAIAPVLKIKHRARLYSKFLILILFTIDIRVSVSSSGSGRVINSGIHLSIYIVVATRDNANATTSFESSCSAVDKEPINGNAFPGATAPYNSCTSWRKWKRVPRREVPAARIFIPAASAFLRLYFGFYSNQRMNRSAHPSSSGPDERELTAKRSESYHLSRRL